MQDAIVRDMAVRHDKIVVTDDGFAFAGSTTVHRDELAEDTVVAYYSPSLFAFVFEILRNASNYGIGEDMAVVTKYHIIVYVRERINCDIPADLSFRAHVSQWADIIYHFDIYFFIWSFRYFLIRRVSGF
jgi:hypothetical protein